MTTTGPVHIFEKAGLGKAPFRLVGVETSADRAALNAHRAANGQCYTTNLCGGTCDYCGQAIFNVFRIESADGKDFKVGCDCVRKTGDAGLTRVIDDQVRKIERDKRRAAKVRRLEAAKAYCEERLATFAGTLASLPHPNDYRARSGETLLDYARFMASGGYYESLAAILRKVS